VQVLHRRVEKDHPHLEKGDHAGGGNLGGGTSMTTLSGKENGASSSHGLLLWGCAAAMLLLAPVTSLADNVEESEHQNQMSVNNRSAGYGIDPDTACSDVNLDEQITPDECQGRDWSWTATDPQVPPLVNTQNGNAFPAEFHGGIRGDFHIERILAGPSQ
jgi:hypothetical protein